MALSDILGKFAKLKARHDPLLDGIGTQVALSVHDRTLAGKDMHGVAFVPYAKSTLAFRAKHGRSGKVDLRFGKVITPKKPRGGRRVVAVNMLGNMTHKVNGTTVVVFFPNEAENAKAYAHHNGKGHLPSRKFFGLSKHDAALIMKRVREYYAGIIND